MNMLISDFSEKSGLYLVAESIDCGGKGAIINAIKDDEAKEGRLVVDLRLLWPSDEEGKIPPGYSNPLYEIYGTDDVIPEYEELKKHYLEKTGKKIDSVLICEPTWARTGLKIRKKLIHEVKGLGFAAKDTAEAYAEDRQELISKLIRPAILDGVDVYCERNFCSSVVYQSSMDQPLSVQEILGIEGNSFAFNNAPHIYIICDVSAETAMKRKALRKKDDKCKFEVPEFQRRIEGKYRSEWLRDLLVSHGSSVVYVNTETPKTSEHTKAAASRIVRLFKDQKIRPGQRFNYNIV